MNKLNKSIISIFSFVLCLSLIIGVKADIPPGPGGYLPPGINMVSLLIIILLIIIIILVIFFIYFFIRKKFQKNNKDKKVKKKRKNNKN